MKGKKLLDAFDEAAQEWGWESDQGVSNVENSHEKYLEEYDKLLKYIETLESKLKNKIKKEKKI